MSPRRAGIEADGPGWPPVVPLPLLVYHVSQDDPKKNTARKLARFELVTLLDRLERVPRGALPPRPAARARVSARGRADGREARPRRARLLVEAPGDGLPQGARQVRAAR